jgi:regulatory protein
MARQRLDRGKEGTGGSHWEPPAHLQDDADADPESVARTICLRLLTIRARTRVELDEALTARAVPRAAVDRVLDRLTEVGLIDDQAFAAQFVAARHQDRGLARRELSRQLRNKGVDDSVVAEALAGLDADQELQTGHRLVERRIRSMAGLEPVVQTRRLVGMLARKGYSPSMAFQIVRDVIGAEAEGADSQTAWLA